MSIAQLFLNIAEHHELAIDFSENLESLYSLEFTDSGLVIKNILDKRYPDGITGLEDVKVSGNSIIGIFLDQISPSVTKKFNFAVNSDSGTVVYDQIDTGDLNFSEVDFAVKKNQSCTEGKSSACSREDGSIYCIPIGRKCSTSKKLDSVEMKAIKEIVEKAPKQPKTSTPKKEKQVDGVNKAKNVNANKPIKKLPNKAKNVNTNKPIKKLPNKENDTSTNIRKINKEAKDKLDNLLKQKNDLRDEGNALQKAGAKESEYRAKWKQESKFDAKIEKLRKEADAKINNLVMKAVENTYQPPKPVAKHGMSDTEDMFSVEFDGVKYHASGKLDANNIALQTIKNLVLADVPNNITKHTKNIYFTSQKSKGDEYWEKEYGMKDLESLATGGDGDVVVYNSKLLSTPNLVHEMGHNLAMSIYGDTKPPSDSKYASAIQEDGSHLSEYGNKSVAEDFAETARMFMFEGDRLKKSSPNRYNVMKEIIENQKE